MTARDCSTLTVLRSSAASLLLASLVASSGCVRWMRDPEFYSQELTTLLEAQEAPIAACYERQLEHEPKLGGELVVTFEVEKRTGALKQIAVDPASTVPTELGACVTDTLATLNLEPPDAKTGVARFAWKFTPGSRKQPPADPFSSAQMAVLGCYSNHLATIDREAAGLLVVDYAFDRASGALTKLEVVAPDTTAPAALVTCATDVMRAVKVEPRELEDRNAAGRRSFTLKFEPWVASE
jgi:hypothetical protein